MSTELIDKLSSVLSRYKGLSADLAEVQKILSYAQQHASEIRVTLKFSAMSKSSEFPYPTAMAINQLKSKETELMADIEAIEDKIDSFFGDST
jgi:hypothetical protein